MKRKDSIKNDVWFLLIKIGFLAVLLIYTWFTTRCNKLYITIA